MNKPFLPEHGRDRMVLIANLMKEHPEITIRGIGEKLGLTRGQVTGILHRYDPQQKVRTAKANKENGLKQKKVGLPAGVGNIPPRHKKCQGFLDLINDLEPTCKEDSVEGKSYCEAHLKTYTRSVASSEKKEVKGVAGL